MIEWKCPQCDLTAFISQPVLPIRCSCGHVDRDGVGLGGEAIDRILPPESTVVPVFGVPEGTGEKFSEVVKELRLNAPPCAGCDSLMLKMNQWGPKECLRRREEIIKEVKANASSWGWFDFIIQCARAGTTVATDRPAWFRVTDPYGSILDEAIRRSEVKV